MQHLLIAQGSLSMPLTLNLSVLTSRRLTSKSSADPAHPQAFGVYSDSVINASLAQTDLIVNITVTTAAECQSLVRERYPEANAAEYSNEGHAWCKAVFNA